VWPVKSGKVGHARTPLTAREISYVLQSSSVDLDKAAKISNREGSSAQLRGSLSRTREADCERQRDVRAVVQLRRAPRHRS
jgi:hypothetical protein